METEGRGSLGKDCTAIVFISRRANRDVEKTEKEIALASDIGERKDE